MPISPLRRPSSPRPPQAASPGRNTGLIAVCENTGTVGYEHVGYNVGGIAGVTSGYLLNNTNSGTIYGRKDVGGIAGQVEPYVAVTVSESTKEQLQNQLKELKTLTDQATADAGGAAKRPRLPAGRNGNVSRQRLECSQ